MIHKSPPAGRTLLGRLSRSLGNIAISLAVILMLLAATEITLRVLNFPLLRLVAIESNAGYAHDSEARLVSPPQQRQATNRVADGDVSHNSLGLRDIELVPAVGPTILFLGSSYVYENRGRGRRAIYRASAIELARVRIVNAGIPGYSNDQQYVLLQRLWPRVEPNVVVLIFGSGERSLNRSNFTFEGFKPYLENIDGSGGCVDNPSRCRPNHICTIFMITGLLATSRLCGLDTLLIGQMPISCARYPIRRNNWFPWRGASRKHEAGSFWSACCSGFCYGSVPEFAGHSLCQLRRSRIDIRNGVSIGPRVATLWSPSG